MGLPVETLVLKDIYVIMSWFSSRFCVHLKIFFTIVFFNGDFEQPSHRSVVEISPWVGGTSLFTQITVKGPKVERNSLLGTRE